MYFESAELLLFAGGACPIFCNRSWWSERHNPDRVQNPVRVNCGNVSLKHGGSHKKSGMHPFAGVITAL